MKSELKIRILQNIKIFLVDIIKIKHCIQLYNYFIIFVRFYLLTVKYYFQDIRIFKILFCAVLIVYFNLFA